VRQFGTPRAPACYRPPVTSARQRSILEAALRLAHRYGPTKTTVADIAREARVGVGSVYLEFPSKAAILGAISRHVHGQVLEAERRALGSTGTPDARLCEALRARFDAFVTLARGPHGPELFHCARCAAIHDAHAEFRAREQVLFAEFLGAAADAFRVTNPSLTARLLLRAHAAYAPPLLFRTEPERLREELQPLHDLLLAGLRRR